MKKSSSEYGHVGTLSRRAEKPDSMQKELVHFDVLELRKRPKTVKKRQFSKFTNFIQFLDVFSAPRHRNSLILFALNQASQREWIEYPHDHVPTNFRLG